MPFERVFDEVSSIEIFDLWLAHVKQNHNWPSVAEFADGVSLETDDGAILLNLVVKGKKVPA